MLADSPQPVFDPLDGNEIVEGLLYCDTCKTEYPILCGLVILIPETNAYLRRSYSAVMQTAVENDLHLSRPMMTWLRERGADLDLGGPAGSRQEDSVRGLNNYLQAHFDRHSRLLQSIPPGHSLEAFLKSYEQGDLYHVITAMALPYLKADQVVLDIGCHVGRMTGELAAHCALVFGLDFSFTTAFMARRVLRGWPVPITSYEFFHDGLTREKNPLDIPLHLNAEVFVGTGLNLPFADNSLGAVNSTNVLDIIGDPMALLGQTQRVLQEEGLLLLTTPYHGKVSMARFGERRSFSASQAMNMQVKEMFETLDEADLVPWVLSEHQRRLLIYLNQCFVGRKPVKKAAN